MIVSVALSPFAKEPTVHIHNPDPLSYAPPAWDRYVKPDGSTSFTETFVAFAGPALETVIVNVTFEPTLTLVGLTDFTMLKSATGTPSSSSVSLEPSPGVESGSNWSEVHISAQFVVAPSTIVLALIFKVTAAPFVRSPISQIPVSLVYFPALSSLTYLKSAGSKSLTLTPVASSGPSFVTVTVNCTNSSKLGD